MVLLPSCQFCGGCGCECGTLPYTVTVEFSGLQNKSRTPHCVLEFESCFGSGAEAVAMLPGGGENDKGPLTSVLLIDGGCGYAKRGRVQPTITIKGTGTGATFTPTLTEDQDTFGDNVECGCPHWKITAIAVEDGTDYTWEEELEIKAADGDTTVIAAEATLYTVRDEPEDIRAIPDTGTGAVLSVTLALDEDEPLATWEVVSVTVVEPGSDYMDGADVFFEMYGPRDRAVRNATGTLTVGDGPPNEEEFEFLYGPNDLPGTGSGAEFDISFTPEGDLYALNATLVSGGTGYTVGEELLWGRIGDEFLPATVYVIDSVDENGAITAISKILDGYWEGSGSGILSVTITDGGAYYKDTGIPDYVEVTEEGKYYRESDDVPACVANVVITAPCSDGGTEATIEPVIDSDPESPTWGQIIDLTIASGGTDNLAWERECTNLSSLNDVPFVLKAVNPRKLVYVEIESCFGRGACVTIDTPPGDRVEPIISYRPACESDAEGSNCGGGTITVTLSQQTGDDGLPYWTISNVTASGGQGYDDGEVDIIFTGCAVVLEEADITITAEDGALSGATVNNGGRFYRQLDYDGSPTPLTGATVVLGGTGYAKRGREPPQFSTVLGFSGSGATFTPVIGEQQTDDCGLPYWTVESITIGGEGTGYDDRSTLTVDPADSETHPEFRPARGRLFTRQEPTEVTATARSPGAGASLAVNLVQQDGEPYTWGVASVSVIAGGKNYAPGGVVEFSVPPRVPVPENGYGKFGHYEDRKASAYLVVNKEGSITNVVVQSAGTYWLDLGVPQQVVMLDNGFFYKENPALDPYVATPTAVIKQLPPSAGEGASILLEIGTDTSNQNQFGRIIGATVDEGGSNYTIFGGPKDCRWEGGCGVCGTITNPTVELRLRGHGKAPHVVLESSGLFQPQILAVFSATGTLADCDSLPESATLLYGAESGSASITRGGLWDSRVVENCQIACRCPAEDYTGATEISITSDFPCNAGTASYDGPIDALDFGCEWTDPETNITYESDVDIAFSCCPTECNDDGECVYEVYAALTGTLITPDGEVVTIYDGQPPGGTDGCGDPSGPLTIEFGGYTFTVTVEEP